MLAIHQRDALGQIYEDAESMSRCAGTNGGVTRLVVPLVVLSDPRDKLRTSGVHTSLLPATLTQHSLRYHKEAVCCKSPHKTHQ
jgi:hypothetical protein